MVRVSGASEPGLLGLVGEATGKYSRVWARRPAGRTHIYDDAGA